MSKATNSSVVFSSSLYFQRINVNEGTFLQKSSASDRHAAKIGRLGLLNVLARNCAPDSERAGCRTEISHEAGGLRVFFRSLSSILPGPFVCVE